MDRHTLDRTTSLWGGEPRALQGSGVRVGVHTVVHRGEYQEAHVPEVGARVVPAGHTVY